MPLTSPVLTFVGCCYISAPWLSALGGRAAEDAMKLDDIESRLRHLLTRFGDGLPSEQVEDMKELVAAGEPGIALENYCTQLLEYDVAVPSEVVAELEALGRAMGINESYWNTLRA